MDLKFDKMTVDTTLAQDFLKNEKNNISLLTSKKYKGFDGDKFYNGNEAYKSIHNGCSSINLRRLAVLIKENTDLFAQLEYSIREVPIEDTKVQLNLIIQQLYHISSCIVDSSTTKTYEIEHDPCIDNNFKIILLGLIVRIMERDKICPRLIPQSKTVAVCYLFSKLCHKAGLVVLTEYETKEMEGTKDPDSGTVGVISEVSDVDSAVDVFLSSSLQVPWKLKRLFVQESVYQQFKDALTWKCNLNKQGEGGTPSTDILEYNGRTFLLDSIAVSDPQPNQVTVEAYRTRKELLTLLNECPPNFLSLWANDIAEINELTHSILSPVTWVNNFGDFRGPSKISECIFSNWSLGLIEIGKNKKVCDLLKLRRSWLTLTIEARRVILCNTLAKFLAAKSTDQRNEKLYTDLKDILNELEVNICSGFVNVDKDYVCVGIPTHYTKLLIWEFNSALMAFFKSLLYGNSFGLKYSCCPELIDVFKNAGIPVILLERSDEGDEKILFAQFSEYTTNGLDQAFRVIWTNSGTIFAN